MTTARGSTTPQAAGTLETLASVVVNTPEGNIAATNVQDAINELDTEKVAKAGDTMTGDLTVPNLITSGNVDGRDVSVDGTKLDTIESGATADQTAAEIKTAYESNADTNAFTDAEKTNLGNQSGTNTGDEPAASLTVSGIIELATQAEVDTGTDALRAITPSTLAGSALQTKVNGIETGATADQTGAEIKSLYQAEPSAFTDAQFTKLSGIETGATADQTAGEIEAIVSHDNLLGFVANEHIDHSAVSISAGTGLTGGGTIAATRTLSLNVNGLTADASPIGSTDYLVTYDASAGTHKKVLIDNLPSAGGANYVQHAVTLDVTYKSGTTQVPFDDTIPQSTEGNEYITVTITPTNSANTIIVEGVIMVTNTSANTFAASIFKDSETGARSTSHLTIGGPNWMYALPVYYEMVAGSTSAITFKVRAGLGGSGTTSYNGHGGSRKYGGVLTSWLKATEVSA